MGSRGNKESSVTSWRDARPEYQRQTAGGVYFWSSSNPVYGKDIDEKMYDRLPKRMQAAVVALYNSRTMDGNHARIYYVNSSGQIKYFDEYGLGDFYAAVKNITDVGNVSDWEYTSGNYKAGEQLKRRNR